MMLTRRQGLAAGAALLAAPRIPLAQSRERPFRFVVNVGLQNLDPISSPSFVTRNFGYLVFDNLVGMDMKGGYRPQMLQGWDVSADRLTWTFRLRPGLAFHDGAPVTSEDVVASLKRWGARDSIGRRLMAATAELTTAGSDGFVLRLSRPYGGVIEALGKPSVHTPFIMPARIASATPPTQPVREIMGSGPFVFLRDQWIPGERTFFRKNERYVPRDEPADGLAGGKVPKVERVEMITMPDIALRAASLQQGEVDYLEYAPVDNLPLFRRDRNIVISEASGIAEMLYGVSINHYQPPFDKVLVRRAVQQCLDRREILAGAGFAELGRPDCASMFMCGTPFETNRGSEPIADPSLDRARALLREAGYNNERVVLLHPLDSALLNPFGLVLIDRLKRAGFNLDVQGSDWSSIAQRWVQRQPLDQGGWSLVPVVYTGFDMSDPLSNMGVGFNCTNNQPWGYCDAEMTTLIERFEAEGDPARRKELAGELNRVAIAQATFPIAGQFRAPAAWRRELRGVIDFGFPVVWNLERGGR
ncbi:ABC transporter substrate-binding protein [Falsiroseomonas bella]|uniref:ABC transporter substrate-binding protein n=1 Tax=Falsiroseomonas bella TaxID=2184016 RepID=A0A317FAI7_9PROT|nr:ABC transporter substrate-binding protein [Falsiroseomonas bella]PWS36084.1 ABC transporter substrate-binding protein [Falsiroseomonas bella]